MPLHSLTRNQARLYSPLVVLFWGAFGTLAFCAAPASSFAACGDYVHLGGLGEFHRSRMVDSNSVPTAPMFPGCHGPHCGQTLPPAAPVLPFAPFSASQLRHQVASLPSSASLLLRGDLLASQLAPQHLLSPEDGHLSRLERPPQAS